MEVSSIFKPKPNKFLQLLSEQTHITVDALGLLREYMANDNPETAKKIAAKENEADEVRRILIEELMRTFVTPFDREDIFSLSREIDDVLDYAYTTVDEMEIMDVAPTQFMVTMTGLLRDASQEIDMAVQRLQDKHFKTASDHTRHAKSLENEVEKVYREAVADLFSGPKTIEQVMVLLKTREIYRHLSNASDRVDSAANVIADIVMKMS